mmetsp:Transcript_16351/g.38711  ORF Transcript_16351/g.38711 Transcript_16351/m.38711 type:complete len:145 (-) Transcript_16351:1503-1937(-)
MSSSPGLRAVKSAKELRSTQLRASELCESPQIPVLNDDGAPEGRLKCGCVVVDDMMGGGILLGFRCGGAATGNCIDLAEGAVRVNFGAYQFEDERIHDVPASGVTFNPQKEKKTNQGGHRQWPGWRQNLPRNTRLGNSRQVLSR